MAVSWDYDPAQPGTFPPELPGQVPPPPPGPGVAAPFATPPTERDRKRLWIGLGVGAALLVLCCGGGLLGLGALVVSSSDALRTQAVTVVSQYLDGLRDQDYRKSYTLLCGDARAVETLNDFTTRQASRPPVLNYRLSAPVLSGSGVVVLADVRTTLALETRNFGLVQDSSAGALRICQGG